MRINGAYRLPVLAIVTTLLAVACGGDDGGGGDRELPPLPDQSSEGELLPDTLEAEGDYRIGFSFPQIDIPFFVNVSYGAVQECERLGIECIFTFGGGYDKPEVQVQDVEDLLAQGVDAISVAPADDVSLVPVLERALDQGVVVTSFSGSITGIDYYGFEGISHYERGKIGADFTVECLQGKGLEEAEGIAVGASRGVGTYVPVEEANADTFGPGSENPNYVIAAHQYTNETKEDAIRVTEDMLSAHPDPDFLVPGAPVPAQGAIEVLQAQGFQPGDVCIGTSGGWDSQMDEYLRDGWIYGMGVQQAPVTGQQNIRVPVAILNGEALPFHIIEPLLEVTSETIGEFDTSALTAPEGYTPDALVEASGS